MSYDIQEQAADWPKITSGTYDYAAPINVQDDADYIIDRTVVLYPTDESVLNEAEKSFVF